jgi:hypothetical protein
MSTAKAGCALAFEAGQFHAGFVPSSQSFLALFNRDNHHLKLK